jgi:hypothetical protein
MKREQAPITHLGEQESGRHRGWLLGGLVTAGILFSGGSHAEGNQPAVELSQELRAKDMPITVPFESAEPETTTTTARKVTTTTARPPETTTTTVPEREPQPGEVIAKVSIPRMCNLQSEVVQFAFGENARVGTDSGIDLLIPEIQPQPDCDEAKTHAEFMRTMPAGQIKDGYATRGERLNSNYPLFLDRNGNGVQELGEEYNRRANAFVPRWGQWAGTSKIGERGNTVLFAHRTTVAATAALLDMLQTGDEIFVTSEGKQYIYKVTDLESVLTRGQEETAVNQVLAVPNGEGGSWLTLFACDPQRDDLFRLVIRARLVTNGAMQEG